MSLYFYWTLEAGEGGDENVQSIATSPTPESGELCEW